MDFGKVLSLAASNKSHATNEVKVKRYTTEVKSAKKEPRSNVQSAAIKAFLRRKEDEEKKKTVDAGRQKEALLNLRAAAKNNRRASAMARRTKDNNFGTRMQEQMAQEEAEAATFETNRTEQHRQQPSAQHVKQRPVPLSHGRPEQGHRLTSNKSRAADERTPNGYSDRGPQSVSVSKAAVKVPSNVKSRPPPPPVDFHSLLNLAKQKQFEPIQTRIPKRNFDFDNDHPMTQEEKQRVLEERARKAGLPVSSVRTSGNERKSKDNVQVPSMRRPMQNVAKKPDVPTYGGGRNDPKSSSSKTPHSTTSIADQLGAKVTKYPNGHRPVTNSKTIANDGVKRKADVPPQGKDQVSRLQMALTRDRNGLKTPDPSGRLQSNADPQRKRPAEKRPYPQLAQSSSNNTNHKHKSMPGQRPVPSSSSLHRNGVPPGQSRSLGGPGGNSKMGPPPKLPDRGGTTRPPPTKMAKLDVNAAKMSRSGDSSRRPDQTSKLVRPGDRPRPAPSNLSARGNMNSRPPPPSPSNMAAKNGIQSRPAVNSRPVANSRPADRPLAAVKNGTCPGQRPVPDQASLSRRGGFSTATAPNNRGVSRPVQQQRERMPASSIAPRVFPPPDMFRKREMMARRPMKGLPMKRRIESDEEMDSDMDDFIDDGPVGEHMDYSEHIREIFGYDKRRYLEDPDDDDEAMESSFTQQMKEEAKSTRAGLLEDLEDIRREQQEKRLLTLSKKKRKS